MVKVNKFTGTYLIPIFLAGLFLAVGVDPEQEIAKAFITIIEEMSPAFAIILRIVLILGGLYLSIIMWRDIYHKYDYMGVVSAGLVFLGIILLVANLPIGVWMLIIGFIIGMLLQGPNRRRHG